MYNLTSLKKLNNDQRGASLAYTLVIIAILMIVGASLGTFAIMSLRLSVMQHASDKAFYLSDAAMEETLTQLEGRVHEAEAFAMSRVNDHSSYYNEAKWVAFLAKLQADTNNGTITQERSVELLEQATNFEFYKQYYFFLFGQPILTTWITNDYTLVDNAGNYVAENTIQFNQGMFNSHYFDFLSTISLDLEEKESYDATTLPTMTVTAELRNNVIELTLQSNGWYNRYQKPITLEVALIPPNYAQIVSTDSTNVLIHKNQILDYALAARGDIIVSGNSNQVNGNVYAYGTFPESTNPSITALGGILLGYPNDANITSFPTGAIPSGQNLPNSITQSAKLTVNGNIYSRASVKLFGENSNLHVTSSNPQVPNNLYANSILTDKNSQNAVAAIDGNAYLFEDLVVDGTNPKITVGAGDENAGVVPSTGELWGLIDANPSSASNFVNDMSSSIIVSTKTGSPRIVVSNLFMSGIAHFDVTTPTATGGFRNYRTGESFTTINNFYFYKMPLTGFNTSFQSEFITYDERDANGNLIAQHNLVEAIDSVTKNVINSPQFKSKYFYTASEQNVGSISARDRTILSIRSLRYDNDNNIVGLNENYNLGIVTANNRVIDAFPSIGRISDANGDGKVDEKDNLPDNRQYMNEGEFTGRQGVHQSEFDILCNVLSTRNYSNNTNQPSTLGQFVAFDNNTVTNIDNPNSLQIINGDPARNIYINIPAEEFDRLSEQERTSAIVVQENYDRFRTINGMIITKGNVFVYNTSTSPFSYNGTIVSDQKICLMGTGPKTFTHSERILENMTTYNNSLMAALHADEGRLAVRVSGSSSSANLVIAINRNATTKTVNQTQIPEGGGLIKSTTEHSFTIRRWSMQ